MRDLKILTFQDTYNVEFKPEEIFLVFIKKLVDYKSIDVIYWNPLEPIGNPINIPEKIEFNEYYGKILYEFESFLIDRDINIYFLFGGGKLFESWANGDNFLIKNVKILPWITFDLHYSRYFLEKSYKKPIQEIKINTDFNKLFFCLNRHPRSQRSLMLDNFCKNDLFDFGLISWNKLSTEWHEPFEFECWEEKRMVLDMSDKIDFIENVNERVDFNTNFLVNNRCLFNVVGETMTGNYDIFISEKTFKNFLIEQPFISVGALYHNKQLEKLNFKLYDEIFNYDFDFEYDNEIRVQKMVKNLNQYKNVDLNEVYNSIKTITIYNKNRSIEITEKDPYIPTDLIRLYKEHNQTFIDNRFIKMECDIEQIFKNI
jgi:hypothetical protein